MSLAFPYTGSGLRGLNGKQLNRSGASVACVRNSERAAPGRSWSSFIRLSRVSSRRPPLIISMRPSRMHMHLKKYLPSVVIRQMLFDGPALQVVGEHDVAYGEVAGPIVTPIGSTRTCRDED